MASCALALLQFGETLGVLTGEAGVDADFGGWVHGESKGIAIVINV